MSTVSKIETILIKMSRAEIEEIRAWIDNFLEDQMELNDDVKAKLDQSHHEVANGSYIICQSR